MSDTERTNALSRLHRLSDDTGSLVAKAIAPIEEAVREIGITYRASHYAEDCRDWDPDAYAAYQAHASRFVFAIEVADGNMSEYCLCVARDPDGRCGLYVSVCESHVETEQRKAADGSTKPYHRVVMDRVYTVRPGVLSIALRAQMLDELNQGNFLGAYRHHVESHGPDGGVNRYWMPGGAR